MKKQLYLLALALMGSLAFISCGDDDEPATNSTTNDTEQTDSSSTGTTDEPSTDDENTGGEVSLDSVVTITYSGSTATVTIPDGVEGVSCTSGTSPNVVLASENTTQELYYVVSGSSSAGSLTISGSYKMTLQLEGVSLASTTGAAIDIQCGKRIALILADGTTNTLSDHPGGTQKACLYTKGHLEISGAGTLNVSGNANHAIATKEYLQLKKTTGAVTIAKAANDAIHTGQHFQMNGGTLTIDQNTVGDGIQVEFKTDDTGAIIEDEDNTGGVLIKGGTLNVTVGGSEDTKGVKAEGDITISGGTLNINANTNGSRGIQTDGNMTIGETDSNTAITIYATGGKCTLAADALDPHKCMGIKVDGDLTVNAGTLTVYNTGAKAKGIRVKGTYTKNGGTVNATVDEGE